MINFNNLLGINAWVAVETTYLQTIQRAIRLNRSSQASNIASRTFTMSSSPDELTLGQRKKALRQTVKSSLSHLSDDNLAEQSRIAQTALLSSPQYRSAKRIGVYLSMPVGEARTELIVRDALESGKSLFVPYIYRSKPRFTNAEDGIKPKSRRSVMEMLRLYSIHEWENLKPDSWGIPSLSAESVQERENAMGRLGIAAFNDDDASLETQPKSAGEDKTLADEKLNLSTVGLDVIVVPGVAFDRTMNRLGHGAGFYDVYLSRFCANGERKKPFLIGLCLNEQFLELAAVPVTDEDWSVDAVVSGDGEIRTLQKGT